MTLTDIGRYTPHLLAGGQISACQSRLRTDLDESLGRAEQIARRATGDRVASVIGAHLGRMSAMIAHLHLLGPQVRAAYEARIEALRALTVSA